MRRLVIGIGNQDRGDDAAGPLVVRGLRNERTRTLTDCAALPDLWKGEEVVVVVDSMISGRSVGSVTELDAHSDLRVQTFPSTHSFGLAEAVELGRALDRLPDSLTIYGIEGSSFELGSDPSPEVLKGVASVVARINARRP